MYHLTKAGPQRCRAVVRPCTAAQADHFVRMKDAVSAFENRLTVTERVALRKPNLKSYLRATSEGVSVTASRNRTIVLSDVDGTLVRGSLVLDHAVWLHTSGALSLGDAPEKWLADQKNELIMVELAEAYREAIRGKSLKDLQVHEFVKMLVVTEGKFYSALDRLKAAHADGHDVVLISGSPQFLVGAFARNFGFTAIGSIYHRDAERRMNGLVTGMFGSEAKQRVIDKLDLSRYKNVIAYGDTASDLPLLRAANHSVLVDPSVETLERCGKVDEILLA